ncbi:hypothetical protein AHAS_Ahas10G0035600 [Arachis hypogaea]
MPRSTPSSLAAAERSARTSPVPAFQGEERAEISVAVATARAAGATPEVRDSMRFIEAVLRESDKHIIALADAYFFSPSVWEGQYGK